MYNQLEVVALEPIISDCRMLMDHLDIIFVRHIMNVVAHDLLHYLNIILVYKRIDKHSLKHTYNCKASNLNSNKYTQVNNIDIII